MSASINMASQGRARRRYLRDVTAAGGGAWEAAAPLILDAIAAIGFAAGLAGAVAAIVARSPMAPWLCLILVSGLARAGLHAQASHTGAARARDVKSALRRRVAIAVLHRPPAAASAGGALTAIVDEVEALDGYVARFEPAKIAATVAPVIVLAAVSVASLVSGLILAATLVPFIVAMAIAGGAAADESHRQFAAMARLSTIFVDRVRSLPIILAFRAGAAQVDAIGSAADEVATRTLRVLARAFLSSAALEFFAALSVALVAVYAGFALLGLLPFHVAEHMTLARGFFVLALAPEFYAPLRRLAAAYHDKQAAETVADRLAGIEADADGATHIRPVCTTAAPALRFEDVTIRYPGTGEPAVSRFSLNIARGEVVALTGASGSGKSSLLKLLLGLAPGEGGRVLIDGEPLDNHAMIAAGYAGQAPILIAGSLAENIALGSRRADRAAVAEVAEAAGLGPLIASREGGLDSRIDERGSGLSGGERRRIALARALLSQSSLLLLDEPTAHLDRESEADLIATIARQRRGRTVLIATHSPALAAIADRVVELRPCN
ncbi:thiol reductant ABC exporter subunit CydD [Sphingomonas oryzagri]